MAQSEKPEGSRRTRRPDASESHREFDQRLQNALPLLTLEFDLPMRTHVGKAGDITIDCPCMEFAGHDRAGVARVHLSPAAASSLLAALRAVGKIQDERGEEPPTRTTH